MDRFTEDSVFGYVTLLFVTSSWRSEGTLKLVTSGS